jgi:tetraacyldisaccharide 4'-kinase
MRALLLPVSWIYGSVAALRLRAFEAGLLRQDRAGVPVLSVGNMTAGGTGKTPFVEYLVAWLLRRGRVPAVVSRGYGRETRGVKVVACGGKLLCGAREGGDEPVQIARKFPGAAVVVAEHRVDAAQRAVAECGADVVVMDDGFQHRYLRRNLDILVMDARRDIRREHLLPAGMRREWLSGINRADLLVFTRSAGSAPPAWAEGLPQVREGKAVTVRHGISGFVHCDDRTPSVPVSPVFAFSGIGDPALFTASLEEKGLVVAGARSFPDHHRFSDADLASVVARAAACGARTIVTTEKDASRLDGGPAGLQVAILAVEILGGGGVLEEMLERTLEGMTTRTPAP